MQKLFYFKLMSKNPRKFASQTFRSNPLHVPQNHHHGLSRYTTFSQTLQQTSTKCLMKVLKDPVLPNALWKLKFPRNFLVGHGGFGFLRAQYRRQTFQFNPQISHERTGHSQFRRRLTVDGVVIGLIVTNVAVFLLWRVADQKFMMQNFMVQLDNFKSGRIHTMITAAFSHKDVGHIVSNMIGLYFFGMSIAKTFGPKFMLKLYLAGAFMGSAFYLLQHAYMASSSKDRRMFEPDPSRIPGLGASGAVNAIMLLDIFLFPTKTLLLEFFIPVPAIIMGIYLIGHDMLRIIEGDSRVSGSAHLGGAAVAAITYARLRKRHF